MGEKTAALEREIRDRRSRIERKVDALEERLRGDASDASSTLADEVVARSHVRDYAEQRPITTMLGAFGAGVVLGIASDGGTSRGSKTNGRVGRENGLLSSFLASTSGAVSGGVRKEVQDLIREFLDGDRGEDGRPSAHSSVDARSMPRYDDDAAELGGG